MHMMSTLLNGTSTSAMKSLDLQAKDESAGKVARLGSELKTAWDSAKVCQ